MILPKELAGVNGTASDRTCVRLPPHNRDAERAILGAMLRDNSIITEAIGLVAATDFYIFAHGIIFGAVLDLHNAGKPADIVTVAERLFQANLTAEIGGAVYLAELCDAAPSARHYCQHATIIRGYAQRRQLIEAAHEIEEHAFNPGCPVADALAEAERRIVVIAERGRTAGCRSEFPSAVVASALQADANPLAWLWRGFIADKGITLFSALWKAGKTTLLAHLVRNMSDGTALCGQEVTPATVLYVSEESEKRWAERRDALGIKNNVHFIERPFKGKPSVLQWLAFM
jgi:DnaB-like helicase N terminal domain/AAA domain